MILCNALKWIALAVAIFLAGFGAASWWHRSGPPAPGPGPVPMPGRKFHITVFIDVQRPSATVSQLLESVTLRQALDDAAHKFRVFDISAPTVSRFLPIVQKAGGPPVLVLQTDDGTVVAAVPLPTTEADFLNVIHHSGG